MSLYPSRSALGDVWSDPFLGSSGTTSGFNPRLDVGRPGNVGRNVLVGHLMKCDVFETDDAFKIICEVGEYFSFCFFLMFLSFFVFFRSLVLQKKIFMLMLIR
jgi:hypothetical protein